MKGLMLRFLGGSEGALNLRPEWGGARVCVCVCVLTLTPLGLTLLLATLVTLLLLMIASI